MRIMLRQPVSLLRTPSTTLVASTVTSLVTRIASTRLVTSTAATSTTLAPSTTGTTPLPPSTTGTTLALAVKRITYSTVVKSEGLEICLEKVKELYRLKRKVKNSLYNLLRF